MTHGDLLTTFQRVQRSRCDSPQQQSPRHLPGLDRRSSAHEPTSTEPISTPLTPSSAAVNPTDAASAMHPVNRQRQLLSHDSFLPQTRCRYPLGVFIHLTSLLARKESASRCFAYKALHPAHRSHTLTLVPQNPNGRLAQLVRAPALQAGCRGFESLTAHHLFKNLRSLGPFAKFHCSGYCSGSLHSGLASSGPLMC